MATVDADAEALVGPVPAAGVAFSDAVLDELLPEDFDWRRVIREHPLTSLAVAATAGYFLGRRSGAAIVDAFSRTASDRVERLAGDILSQD